MRTGTHASLEKQRTRPQHSTVVDHSYVMSPLALTNKIFQIIGCPGLNNCLTVDQSSATLFRGRRDTTFYLPVSELGRRSKARQRKRTIKSKETVYNVLSDNPLPPPRWFARREGRACVSRQFWRMTKLFLRLLDVFVSVSVSPFDEVAVCVVTKKKQAWFPSAGQTFVDAHEVRRSIDLLCS